jgi:hypothetical protein
MVNAESKVDFGFGGLTPQSEFRNPQFKKGGGKEYEKILAMLGIISDHRSSILRDRTGGHCS